MAETIIVAGHAKLPQGMAASRLFEVLAVTVEFELKYGVIINSSSTLASTHTQEYIANILIGHSLLDGIEPLIEKVNAGYHGKAQQAIIAAIKDLYTQFLMLQDRRRKSEYS
jgi:hypothetical protein